MKPSKAEDLYTIKKKDREWAIFTKHVGQTKVEVDF